MSEMSDNKRDVPKLARLADINDQEFCISAPFKAANCGLERIGIRLIY
jgi:hypothetical protein